MTLQHLIKVTDEILAKLGDEKDTVKHAALFCVHTTLSFAIANYDVLSDNDINILVTQATILAESL